MTTSPGSSRGIYRISNPPTPEVPISFNQFLIDDEHPTLHPAPE